MKKVVDGTYLIGSYDIGSVVAFDDLDFIFRQ